MLSKGFQSQMLKFSLCPRPDWVRENWKLETKTKTKEERKKKNPTQNLQTTQATGPAHFFEMFCIFDVSFSSRNFTIHSVAPSKAKRAIGKVVLLNWCNSCYLQECAFQKMPRPVPIPLSLTVNFLLELEEEKRNGTANQIKKQKKKLWRQLSKWPHLVECNHNHFWLYTFSLFATVIQEDFSSDTRVLKLRKS